MLFEFPSGERKLYKMKNIFKLSLHLLLNTFLVCMLSFMAIITLGMVGASNGYINPVISVIFGLLYFFMLMYFFVHTAWVEGGRDNNRVAIGQARETIYKGFLSAAVVVLPIIAIFIVTEMFKQNESTLMGILNILKLIFCWAGVYLTVPLTGGVSNTNIEGVSSLDPMADMLITAILCGVYVVAWICAGVGYIFGYKKISFIPALTNKIMGRPTQSSKK